MVSRRNGKAKPRFRDRDQIGGNRALIIDGH
jgi:hypothetical protein